MDALNITINMTMNTEFKDQVMPIMVLTYLCQMLDIYFYLSSV